MKTPIRRMASDDWPSVRQIYQDGIDGGDATFETDAGDWKSWDSRYRPDCRFVATQDGRVVGWAALSPVSSRDAYRGVAEVSVYVSHQSSMRRVGTDLLQVLVEASESVAIWTLEARVFPENVATLAIHEKLGFRRVGYRERIGRLHETWRDTVLVERRSPRVGTS